MNLIIILCAKYLFIVIGLIAIIYWLKLTNKRKLEVVTFGIITALVAFLLAKIGGAIFYNARPFVVDNVVPLFTHIADNGFPSDHTLFSAVIAVTMYSASKKLGLILGGLSVVVGMSRVLALVHHPIDIVGGLVFAMIGGVAAYYLTPKIMRIRS